MKLDINGQTHEVDAADDMPLLWALRDVLGLTGTKFGCGGGHCGVCTVHNHCIAVRSCVLPIVAQAGKKITTIDGLARGKTLHVVQQAWLDLDVVQCGYCQSGQIMTASALLASNPKPSDAQIDTAMEGNLCRCATYPRIRAAIHAAAETLGS